MGWRPAVSPTRPFLAACTVDGVADDVHTGGMIALVPDADSLELLPVDAGEPVHELHLTLAYLGDDVSDLTDADVAELEQHVRAAAAGSWPLLARVMGHATFNPDGYAGRKPCAVYLIGDNTELAGLHERFAALARVPQHAPWLPHITGGYGKTAADLSYTGPVAFDRLRLALGETVVDVPLVGEFGEKSAEPARLETKGHAELGTQQFAPLQLFAQGVRAGLAGLGPAAAQEIAADLVEFKAGPPGHTYPSPDPGATRLRRFWTRSKEGLAKWRPGEPGAFKRLVKHLRKHVGPRAEGLAAIYYHVTKGYWPGKHSHGHKAAVLTLADLHAAVIAHLGELEHKAYGDEPDDLMASLDGFEALGDGDMLTTEEAWAEAMEATQGVTWEAAADGTLHRIGDAAGSAGGEGGDVGAWMLEQFDQGPVATS